MPELIPVPSRVKAAGTKATPIDEFYSAPEGVEHDVAICLPAFSPDTVRRDEG